MKEIIKKFDKDIKKIRSEVNKKWKDEQNCNSCIVWYNIYLVWNIKTIASIARRGFLKATVVWLPFGSADNG
jgi:hypothetical protein